MQKNLKKKVLVSALTVSMSVSTLVPGIMVFANNPVAPASITTKVNHALQGSATVNDAETSYWGADKAIDGVVNRDAAKPDQSRWSTNVGTTPKILTVDLGSEKSFSEFKIEWERTNIKGYNIAISNDGENYTTVYTKPDDTNIPSLTTEITLENSVLARYVKLTVDKYDGGDINWASVSLYEFEILGEETHENLALNATAASSGNETTGLNANNVKDEDMTTRWASTRGHNDKWVSLDFGSAKDVASVTLKWERCNATNYKIQSSNDGTNWEDVKVLTSAPTKFDDVINFDNTINVRYIRVLITDFVNSAPDRDGKTVAWDTVSLHEFEAYSVKQQVDVEPEQTIDSVIANLVIPAIAKGDTKMAMPEVPNGFEIEFVGADYEQILDRDLTIHQPIVDTTVSVNYKIKKGDQEKTTNAYNVTVPGKHSPEESINAKPKVVPELAEWVGTEGKFEISDKSKIVINPQYKDDLDYLAKTFKSDYQDLTGNEIEVIYSNAPAAHDFYFTLGSSDAGLKEEGYLMTVDDTVKVEAVDKTGAFWSVQTILQVLKQNTNSIPQGQTRDYPKYELRGFMLDVGRMPFSLDILKDIAKNMAYYKMNDFQIHLNDNYIWVEEYGNDALNAYSGFRLESDIKKGGNNGLNKADLTSTDTFYTKDEFRSFIKEAREMGVEIVPEFDTPAHSLALTKVRPDLAMKDTSVARHWDHLDLDTMYDESLAFTQSIFNEYMTGDDPVFDQDTIVNVGTDEYDGKYAENFRKYTDDMLGFIQDTGRTVRLWGSLSMRSGSTPVRSKDVQMNIWNTSWANPSAMYNQGYDLINMVDGTLYMVPGAGYYNDYLNSQNLYNNWQPNNMGGTVIPAGAEQMLGSSYAIWNDMVDKKANGISEYDIYDRFASALPSMSSKLWGDGEDLTYNELVQVSDKLEDAPNSNPFDKVKSVSDTVINYDFNKEDITDKSGNGYNAVTKKNVATVTGKFAKGLQLNGGESYIETPIENMGPTNSASFWVKMDSDAEGEQILFESDKGSVKMAQKDTGKVGFSRLGYDYSFDYTLPKDTWVKLEIKGYQNKAELYVDGALVDTLSKGATGGKYATMVLPLERIGSTTSSFKGVIDNLVVSTTGSEEGKDYTTIDSQGFTVTCDNQNPLAGSEGPISLAFDNNPNTFWHSNYTPYQALPATVDIDMNKVYNVNEFDYLPRQTGSNGHITQYELYVKENEADEFTKVSEGNLAGNSSLKKITFDAVKARYVRFVALAGTSDSSRQFASAAEFTVRQVDDKADLRKAISTASNYESEYYTAESWKVFSDALTVANDILDKEDATEAEITNAAKTLIDAIDSLVEVDSEVDVNKIALLIAIELAEEVTQEQLDKVVPVVATEFKAALENAKTVYGKENATQGEVDKAADRLITVMQMLEFYKGDKTALSIAIDMAEAVTQEQLDKVVPVVADEFKAALENAKDVYADENALENDIDDAFDRLAKVMQMLEFYKGDKAALQKLMNQIAVLTASDYTDSTWSALQAVLPKANEVLDNVNAMQGEVDEVYTELVKAFLNLRLKPNKDLLADLINKANGLNKVNFTAASWGLFEPELENANKVLNDPEATRDQVEKAVADLNKAIAGLVVNPSNPPVDNNTNVSTGTVKPGDTTVKATKTGDTVSMMYPLAGLAAASVVFYGSKKKKKNK